VRRVGLVERDDHIPPPRCGRQRFSRSRSSAASSRALPKSTGSSDRRAGAATADGCFENTSRTLLGGTATPSNGTTVTRNAGASIFLSGEDEWYKAAYYDAASASYFDYPAGSDTPTTCTAPTATANTANCDGSGVGDLTDKGSYTGSPSPNGTFDQGGNVYEWTEAIAFGARVLRGGSFDDGGGGVGNVSVFGRAPSNPSNESFTSGFRVAPEPSSDVLLMTGILGGTRPRWLAQSACRALAARRRKADEWRSHRDIPVSVAYNGAPDDW
jgi:hypothetical protein